MVETIEAVAERALQFLYAAERSSHPGFQTVVLADLRVSPGKPPLVQAAERCVAALTDDERVQLAELIQKMSYALGRR